MVDPSEHLPPNCAERLVSRGTIDRAGDALREDPTSLDAREGVQCFRLFRLAALNDNLDTVLSAVNNIRSMVSGRLKRVSTTIRKLARFPRMRLSQMSDIVGLRIVCESLEAMGKTVAAVSAQGTGLEIADYVSEPQPTGYRAVHVYLRTPQVLPGGDAPAEFRTEVQVRTFWQHLWALRSESLGEQVKEGGGPPESKDHLVRLSRAIREREEKSPDEVQAELPRSDGKRDIAVVRRRRSGDEPVIDRFNEDYAHAIAQLIAWENSTAEGMVDTLLLVGIGGAKVLGYTHAVFLGMQHISLPSWAPVRA